MPFSKVVRKVKGIFSTREKDKRHRQPVHAYHSPSSELHHPSPEATSGHPDNTWDPYAAVPQGAAYHHSAVMDSRSGLRPADLYNQAGSNASIGVVNTGPSIYPANTQSYHDSTSRSPPYQSQALGPPYYDVPSVVQPGIRRVDSSTFREAPFANAHNFVINNATMIQNGGTEEEKREEQERRNKKETRAEQQRQAEEEKQAQMELAAKGMPGAMLDSRERTYAPRCNEGTRQSLRARILRWERDTRGTERVLWLSGPAAVGKSAVAQTVAETLKKEGLLGAVFFFSRPNDRSDPDVVIPTLVYQLALLIPEYQRIVIKQFVKDPFESLIINPFRLLASQQNDASKPRFLILLDGLDECSNRRAQCEFVEMISDNALAEPSLPLSWMICSRPEPDLKVAFSSDTCKAVCLQEKLEVDDHEAQGDARRILDKGFADIRKRYPDQLPGDWPAGHQVDAIADRASGHLGFASFIVRFIGDEVYDDPHGQLEVCLRFLQRPTGNLEDLNPLQALDLLYTQILSDIPQAILPTTKRILGLFIHYSNLDAPSATLVAAVHANFLGLGQAAFNRALHRLHSVVFVPPASEAASKPIQIYHASFSDYLTDPARSGAFGLDADFQNLDIAITGLTWLKYCHKNYSDFDYDEPEIFPELTWIPSNITYKILLESICKWTFTPCLMACTRIPKNASGPLIQVLEHFDFDLDYCKWWDDETRPLASLILWLTSVAPNLVVSHRMELDQLVSRADMPKTTIWVKGDTDFVEPLLQGAAKMPGIQRYKFFIKLGRSNPVPFYLHVSLMNESRFTY